jgi:hypothetical protein
MPPESKEKAVWWCSVLVIPPAVTVVLCTLALAKAQAVVAAVLSMLPQERAAAVLAESLR